MVLPIAESCQGMELVTGLSDPNKHRQSALVLLLKSGQICLYDDSEIERYLLHSQSRSPPTLPNCSYVKLPYGDSGISVAKFYTCNPAALASLDEACIYLLFLSKTSNSLIKLFLLLMVCRIIFHQPPNIHGCFQ